MKIIPQLSISLVVAMASSSVFADMVYTVTGTLGGVKSQFGVASYDGALISLYGPNSTCGGACLPSDDLDISVTGTLVLNNLGGIVSLNLSQLATQEIDPANPWLPNQNGEHAYHTAANGYISVSNLNWIYSATGAKNGGAALLQTSGNASCDTFNAACTSIAAGISNPNLYGGSNYSNSLLSFDGRTGAQPEFTQVNGSTKIWAAKSGIELANFTSNTRTYNLFNFIDGDSNADVSASLFDAVNEAKLTLILSPTVAEVPVPAAAWLMGSGLVGLVGIARRRK